MDRTYEEVRAEVFELDRESQQRLVDEIEHHWSDDIDDEAISEAARRMEAYRRGEMSSVSGEEAVANVRQMLAEKMASRK